LDKIKKVLKKYIHPFFILCMMLIIIAGMLIIHNSRQKYATEEWIFEYFEKYNDRLSDLDIQVLTQNLSLEIDKKLEELDCSEELTKEQLMALLAMVNEELQYANFSIPQEEVSRISTDIVKKIVAESMEEFYATSHKTDEIIDSLGGQLFEIRTIMEKLEQEEISSISEQQVKEIARAAGLEEETVKNWIREIHSSDTDKYDAAIQELSELLDTDTENLKKLLADARLQDDAIEYLANRLEITEERLNTILNIAGNSSNRELLELAARLKAAESELQNQMKSDMSLITNSITSVQQQIITNKNITEETIQENRQDTLSAIAANRAETDAQISTNKEKTDAAIQELQQNVLFYEYDEDTNTLKLFGCQ
jgi:hypothetical protein